MKRSMILATALLLIAALLGYCQLRATQINAAFGKVAEGDTEQDVILKMGSPHQVLEGCGYYGKAMIGCAREYVYFPPWTIVDEAWSISFSAHGVVIHTAHFVSP
jgi:hypothetical protein